ncbi:cyclic AMP-dependent transcription factor ATF-3 [Exaiptasia diaphana]|uniref:BZIP domain-containing protein n=1 Tax=Exaiptasia diaphana TaxID=2652724 RepID=A0A913XH05_EXADI|nr:cyclic AMP-dependent transcription factor ATF-3 [Exaiptasia diaphana]KXJ12177.1 Basic leucine zipper transcriptional factor ATF-like 3 [Exaiptasia diaphana]
MAMSHHDLNDLYFPEGACASSPMNSLFAMNGLPLLTMDNDQIGNDSLVSLVVKPKLKKAIEEKKLAKGEEIPTIEYKDPPPPQPKPPEKPEDLKRKREKNKIAATKCRQKKKARRDSLLQKIEKWEQLNNEKKREVQELRKEKKSLEDYIKNLSESCICSRMTSAYQPSHCLPAPLPHEALFLLGDAASSVEEMPYFA